MTSSLQSWCFLSNLGKMKTIMPQYNLAKIYKSHKRQCEMSSILVRSRQSRWDWSCQCRWEWFYQPQQDLKTFCTSAHWKCLCQRRKSKIFKTTSTHVQVLLVFSYNGENQKGNDLWKEGSGSDTIKEQTGKLHENLMQLVSRSYLKKFILPLSMHSMYHIAWHFNFVCSKDVHKQWP